MQGGRNPFGHIDLRVNNMTTALRFYGALLPALGFTDESHGPEWKVFAATGELPSVPYFAFIEDAAHEPNHNRIAFWASSPDRVFELADLVRVAGGRITDGPGLFPEYSRDYCAVYFEDPSGNRLEIVHRTE